MVVLQGQKDNFLKINIELQEQNMCILKAGQLYATRLM